MFTLVRLYLLKFTCVYLSLPFELKCFSINHLTYRIHLWYHNNNRRGKKHKEVLFYEFGK